jgi:hypothetical protein
MWAQSLFENSDCIEIRRNIYAILGYTNASQDSIAKLTFDAEQGIPTAQFYLGWYYLQENDEIFPEGPRLAEKWLARSADKLIYEAKEGIEVSKICLQELFLLGVAPFDQDDQEHTSILIRSGLSKDEIVALFSQRNKPFPDSAPALAITFKRSKHNDIVIQKTRDNIINFRPKK